MMKIILLVSLSILMKTYADENIHGEFTEIYTKSDNEGKTIVDEKKKPISYKLTIKFTEQHTVSLNLTLNFLCNKPCLQAIYSGVIICGI